MAGTAADKKRKVQVFDSEEDLAVSLAKYTADLSAKLGKERGSFTVVLSGGSLIKSLRSESNFYVIILGLNSKVLIFMI